MPPYIKCANTWCDNRVDRMGEVCPTCRSQHRQTVPSEKEQRVSIWNRHKGEVKNKHQKVEDK